MISADAGTLLVEEYTGQHCVNCPYAMAELAKIGQEYSGKIITVAMHAQSTGQVTNDLASPEADSYAKEYGVPSSVPGIIINRQATEEGRFYSQTRALWGSFIRRALTKKARYRLQLNAQPMSNGKLDIQVLGT